MDRAVSAVKVPIGQTDTSVSDTEILTVARKVLALESQSIQSTAEFLSKSFVRAVRLLARARSRVVVTGMGKSGIIGKKLASTFSSTGTPAIFIHAAEAVHGDLGMIQSGDVLLALSNSGETSELIQIIPSIRLMGVNLITILGNPRSTLGRQADVTLEVKVEEEGCPLGLAPMSSTTAMLALGDSLAAALMRLRQFKREEFAFFHPKGSLGRRLLLRVADLMHMGESLPLVGKDDPLRSVIKVMITRNLGLALAVDEEFRLHGVISDGDIKRILERSDDFFSLRMNEVMTRNPVTIRPHVLAEVALRKMEENPRRLITVMPVVDESDRVVGLIRLHDILQEKIR